LKNIAFIPVRGGSKSIPLKNIKFFCGKPLVYWTVLAAENCEQIDEVIIATDNQEIKTIVSQFSFSKVVIFDRNEKNAQDTASTESVMLEYIQQSTLDPHDNFILIQATSPLLESEDITKGLELIKHSDYDSVLSGVVSKRFFWSQDGTPINYDLYNRPRRQDFEGMFMENGAFYISTVRDILDSKNRISKKVGLIEMPESSSYEIDEIDDWIIVEELKKRQLRESSQRNKIKLFVTDVDGVLTDAGMYYTENGDELKKFNTRDGMGLQLVRESNIHTAIVTSETTKLVDRRAKKLKIDFLVQGKKHGGKLSAVEKICDQLNIGLSNVAYIGDDINCFELLSAVGYAACPNDAVDKIKSIPGIRILSKKGGEGVVREWSELLLN